MISSYNKEDSWSCPGCGAKHGTCGLAVKYSGVQHPDLTCSGFLCECATDNCSTCETPCENAVCYHCGWTGRFPTLGVLNKEHLKGIKLKNWIKNNYHNFTLSGICLFFIPYFLTQNLQINNLIFVIGTIYLLSFIMNIISLYGIFLLKDNNE